MMSGEKMTIDDKLFAHIHNDMWLSGTKLQGKTFEDTIALFTSYVDTLNDSEKNSELKALREDLNYLKEIAGDIYSNKNVVEISQTIAQKILRKERVLIPGGWVGKPSKAGEPGEPGHALIYCFEINEAGQLLFKIYNSGAGLNFHKIISEVDKERYCIVQQFCIENIAAQENHQEKLVWFLSELIKPQQRDETQSYNERVLYLKIFPKIAYLDGDLIAPPEGEMTLTAGQCSGTCAEKVLHQLTKISHTDKKAYKRFMYNFKKHTLDIYIQQVIVDRRDKEPHVQEQIQLAIDNMARLLGKSDYFSAEEKSKEYQYLSEKKSIFSEKKPPKKQTEFFNDEAFNAFCGESDLFSKPLNFSEETAFSLAESKTQAESVLSVHTVATQEIPSQPPPQNVEALESFLAETKTLVESNPELAIARLETFFLKLPIPFQYDEKAKENVLETLTALYKIYIETYPNFSSIITARNIVCALSFVTVCGQLGKIENITQKRLCKLLEQEKYNPFLGSQEVLCDTRLQEIRNLYKKDSTIELSDLIEQQYVQLIKDSGLYDEFVSIYHRIPERLKPLSKETMRENKNKQALYILNAFFIGEKIKDSPFYDSFRDQSIAVQYIYNYSASRIAALNILREKCAWQNKLERSICAGLSGLTTNDKKPHIDWDQKLTVFDQKESSVTSNLFFGNKTLGTPSRLLESQLYGTQAVEGALLASAHRENIIPSNEIQLGALDSNSSNEGIGSVLRSESSQTWIVRELMHLRTSKKAQLKSTLVFFSKNLSLLAKEDIQYYLEKNIFEPGLLMGQLSQSPEFLQELHNFLIQSSNKFSLKNKPDKTAAFLLYLAIKVNFYADEMTAKGTEENLQLIQKQIEDWLKRETTDVLVLRELHRARILLLANTLRKRIPATLTESEIQQYVESLLIYHHYPMVREYQDALDTRKLKDAISLLSPHIPQELTSAFRKNLEAFLVQLLGNTVDNYIFEFQGQYVVLKNKEGQLCFKVNFKTGDIYDDQDLTYKLVPTSLKANPKFSRFFSEDIKYIWQNSSEKVYKIEQPKGTFYRITKLDSNDLAIEKKIGSPASWFRLIDPPREFPCTITKSHNFWEREGKIYASEIESGKITHCYNNATKTITLIEQAPTSEQLTETQYVLLNQESYLHNMFSKLEDKSFVEVYKNNKGEEPKFIARLPRYNFELNVRENTKKNPPWEFIRKDTDEELVLNENSSLIPGSNSQLRFTRIEKAKEKEEIKEGQDVKEKNEKTKKKKLKETLVIPRQQFFLDTDAQPNQAQEHKTSAEHSFNLDISDTIRNAWLKKAKISDRHYNNLESCINYTIEKDKIIPNNMEDGLYLVYTYLCNKNPDKALETLSYLHERFSGLKGTAKEIETIRWIINSTPAFLEKKQQEAILENPKVFSIKLKTLSLLAGFNRDHPGYKLPERNSSQYTDVEAFQKHTQAENEKFFKGLPNEIFSIYNKYHHGKGNVPAEFLLSTTEKLVLLRTCFISKMGKEAGSLQLEWRKLEREQFILELNNLKNKSEKTNEDVKRVCDVTELLEKQKKISKHTSKFFRENTSFHIPEKFALDSSMVSSDILNDIAKKFQSLIISEKPPTEAQRYSSYGLKSVQYLDSKKLQDYIETLRLETIEKLISLPVDEKMWIESFYGLCYKISTGNLTPTEVEKLKKFCLDTIKAYRHESTEHPGNLSQLCKALFVVLNNPSHFQGCELKSLNVDSSEKIFSQATLNAWFDAIFSESKKLCPNGIMVNYNEQRKTETNYEASEINWDKIIDLVREACPILSKEVTPLAPFNFSESFKLQGFYQEYYNIEAELNKEMELLNSSQEHDVKKDQEVKEKIEPQKSYSEKREIVNKLDESIGRLQNEYALKKQVYAVQNLGLLNTRTAIADSVKTEHEKLKTDLKTSLEEMLRIANTGTSDSKEGGEKAAWDLSVLGRHKHQFTKDNFKALLLRLYMKNDINAYQAATGLQKKEILDLHNAIIHYLWLAQKKQQCKRIENKLKCIPALDITEKSSETLKAAVFNLSQEMTEKNLIDPQKDQVLMVFQYASKILIREKQKKSLEVLKENAKEEYESKVIQLIMGGGKTKVLLPILALKKATGTNLSVIEVPDALFETNYKDLNNVSESLFGQTAYKFIFDRNAPCDALALKKHYRNFNQVMLSRGYVITTNNSVKSLMMKYAELLEQGPKGNDTEWKKQVKWLSRILKFYKTKADGLIDEADSSLDIRTQFNYTIGKPENVTEQEIKNILSIHQFVNNLRLDIANEEDRKKIAKEFINNRNKENPLACYLDYLEQLLKDTVENPKELIENFKKSIVEYLLNKGESIPPEINGLKDEQGKAIFALVKYHLSVLLPYTATQKIYENFGPSQSNEKSPEEKSVAIPYEGNDQPRESYKFGNHLETIGYTIHASLKTGISIALFNKVLKEQLDGANNELRNSVEILNIDETETGKIFNAFLQKVNPKLKLSEIDLQDSKQLETLYKTLSKNEGLIYFCLKNYILPKVEIESLMLTSDPHNHVGLYRSVQGVTGTPWNIGSLHQSLSFEQKESLGTDGVTVDLLKRKIKNVHVVDDETPAAFLESAFKKMPSVENIRAIIDIGARFRGVPNEKAVEIISDFCAKKGSVLEGKIKFVLFFKKNAQGKDELYALDTKSKDIKYIGSSDKKIIKACLGCKPHERFTYYDQTHCIGTDVLQDNEAKAIVTVDKDTLQKDLLQGVMRMRGLAVAQDVEVFVSPEIKELLEKEGLVDANKVPIVDINSIIELTNRNQNKRVLEDHFRATIQKMHNLVREAILKSILDMDDKNAVLKKTCFDSAKGLFILEENKDLFDLYGNPEKSRKIIKIFKELEEKLLFKMDNISLPTEEISSLKNKLTADFEKLIQNSVPKCPERVFYTKAPLFGQAVQTQQASQTQQQKQEQAQQKAQAQQQANITNRLLPPIPFDNWIQGLTFENFMAMQVPKDLNKIKDLNHVYTDYYNSRPSLQFYPSIFSSVNAYKTCTNFSAVNAKAVHAVLMRETVSGDIEAVIITYPEVDQLGNILSDPKNGHPHHAWVVSSSGEFLLGKKPEKMSENYDKILTQIQFFNGDFLALGKHDPLDHWLLEYQKMGFNFFEQKVKPFRNIEQWQIDILKNRLQDLDKAYQFVLEKNKKSQLAAGWEQQFTKCTPADLQVVKVFEEFIVFLKKDSKMFEEKREFESKYIPFCTYRYLGMIIKNKDEALEYSFLRYVSKDRQLLISIIEEAISHENYNMLEKILSVVLPVDENFHDYLMKKIAFITYNKEEIKPSLDLLFSKINALQDNGEKTRFYENLFTQVFQVLKDKRDISWMQLSVFFKNTPEEYIKMIFSNPSHQQNIVDKVKKCYSVDSDTFAHLAQYLPKDVFLSLFDSDKTTDNVVLRSLSQIKESKILKHIIDVIGLEKYMAFLKEPQDRFKDTISTMLSTKESAKELLEIFGDQKDQLLEKYGFEAAKAAIALLDYRSDFKQVLHILPKEPVNLQEQVFFKVVLGNNRFDSQSRLEKFEYYVKEWGEEKMLEWLKKNQDDWSNTLISVDNVLSKSLLSYFKKSEYALKAEHQPFWNDSFMSTQLNQESVLKLCSQLQQLNQLDEPERLFYQRHETKINSALQYYFTNNEVDIRQILKTMITEGREEELIVLIKALSRFGMDFLEAEDFLSLLKKSFRKDTLLTIDPTLSARTIVLSLQKNDFSLSKQLLEKLAQSDLAKEINDRVKIYLNENKKTISESFLELMKQAKKPDEARALLMYYFDLEPELLNLRLLENIRADWGTKEHDTLFEKHFDVIKKSCISENKQKYISLYRKLSTANTVFSKNMLPKESAQLDLFWLEAMEQGDFYIVDSINQLLYDTPDKLNNRIVEYLQNRCQDANVSEFLCKLVKQYLNFRASNDRYPGCRQVIDMIENMQEIVLEKYPQSREDSCVRIIETSLQEKGDENKNVMENIRSFEELCRLYIVSIPLATSGQETVITAMIDDGEHNEMPEPEVFQEEVPSRLSNPVFENKNDVEKFYSEPDAFSAGNDNHDDFEHTAEISTVRDGSADHNVAEAEDAFGMEDSFGAEEDGFGSVGYHLGADDLDDGFGFAISNTQKNYRLPLKILIALSSYWPQQTVKDFMQALSYPINYNQAETLSENTTSADFLKLYTFCRDNNIDSRSLTVLAEEKWPGITEKLRAIDMENGESKSEAESHVLEPVETVAMHVLHSEPSREAVPKEQKDEKGRLMAFRFRSGSGSLSDAEKEKEEPKPITPTPAPDSVTPASATTTDPKKPTA